MMSEKEKVIKNSESAVEKDNKGYTHEDVRRIHDEAYKQGFGDGFDKANELVEVEDEDDEPEE